ncbi:16S rRNA (guanine(966)-N(2))-methyltransferase RsmD [Desulfohalobium retbaense]|uniref:Methyltransferase n=1 Tax=Desulfohalobium retbaense (strain ATCC 49708 / DSM 5692 / JCM 16813 / HR100) TaxID=485915 RepID=C8X3G3_DESRD|nr:16S rRNA (guanine(966)-N(2))-methyltransferase RsmD [Desulfohalobium retbaense]ACV68960.1 methyltransferase [Desulfohalobium retbaense DSM 5692]
MRIISGIYKGRQIATTSGPGYRPATLKVREALFSMLEARGVTWPEARVLDLFAGSGSLAFEALSRGAATACVVEKNRRAAGSISKTARSLGLDRGQFQVVTGDVQRFLHRPVTTRYDVVFVDPPYGQGVLLPALETLTSSGWLAPEAFVVAEVEAQLNPGPNTPAGLVMEVDRLYGQTRICIWQAQ